MIDVDCFLAWQYLEDCYYAPHQVTDLIQLMVGFNSCSTLERTVADAAEWFIAIVSIWKKMSQIEILFEKNDIEL